jgi:Zn-dependent protease
MNNWLFDIVLKLPALLLGIGLHEWAHAYVADRHGDGLPESEGRLSLNPLDHLDPIGTIAIFVAGFGWGKPVMINPAAYRNPLKDQMKVALAGPMMNLAIASVTFLVYWACKTYLPLEIVSTKNILIVVKNIALINLALALFNLLPIPPLDGSKIARYLGSVRVAEILGGIEMSGYGIFIVLFLVWTHLIDVFFIPVVSLFVLMRSSFGAAVVFAVFMAVLWGLFLRSFPRIGR